MKLITTIFFSLLLNQTWSQIQIQLNQPLNVVATERVSMEVKKGDKLELIGFDNIYSQDFASMYIICKAEDGSSILLDPKKIKLFEFLNIENREKIWDKNLVFNGVYANLIQKGMQYELRNELNNEAVEFINILSTEDRFFKDAYFEDYLYSLLNKIHIGILSDRRPGNLYIKILKETQPNAFALPNGCIIITTGLLSTIQSEDELIGILAHEVAHFVLDHQIMNYNKSVDRKKRAEFWSAFATVVAASADVYLTSKNSNHIPGILTASTAIAASVISEEIITQLGVKYNQEQEIEADKAAKELISILKYNKLGLSAALQRIKNYCILTGNYIALSGSGSHPSLDSRINQLGMVENLEAFTQNEYLKKVSLINSYNAWIELWYFSHHLAAKELADRNIKNGIGTETDYLVKAVVLRRLLNTKESNEEVIDLISKAKSININSLITLYKEEALTLLRLGRKEESKKSFQTYLSQLNELKAKLESSNKKSELEDEIDWTKKMIFKIDII
jgi:Zn-dependent protease with chaperone function